MDIQCVALLGGVALCIIMVIVCIVYALREKDKWHYLGAGAGFLTSLMFVSVIINQHQLFWVFMISAAVLTFVWMPKMQKYRERKAAEEFQKLDLSAPLRLRDLFITKRGWMRFAYRWGVRKYIFSLWLTLVALIAVTLFALKPWLEFMDAGYIILYTFTFSTGIAVITYSQLKAAIKKQKASDEGATEKQH